jgi:ADP-ribose pyrophosphatase YjhB (NUDIX family)
VSSPGLCRLHRKAFTDETLTTGPVTHHNREDVDRRLARLGGEYDPLVEHETETLAPEDFDPFAEHAAEGYTGGGYAWVVREEPKELSESMPDVDEAYPRVLLGLGRGDFGWGPAGGGRESEATGASNPSGTSHESDESYEDAAEREVREETGVECEVLDCRRVRRVTFHREGTEDVIHTLWVYFVARETGGSIDVQESELNGAAWFHDLPEDLHRYVREHPWSWDEWRDG